ncbi:MAG TPA: hypothetical protein VMW58_14145 [Anaerolineae bacterium]|nr:hypothetical protein [Anaerolineae bacterium]
MRRITPRKLLSISLITAFLALVLPFYAVEGLDDSFEHARGTVTVGGIDSRAYYIAADMLRSGKDLYDVEHQTQEVSAGGLPLNESYYIYPPLIEIVFVPLTALSTERAAQVRFFLNLGSYCLSLSLSCRSLRWRHVLSVPSLLWILGSLSPTALFTLCVVPGRLAYLDWARKQGRGHHDLTSACAESGRAPT